jgi:membrane-associated protein
VETVLFFIDFILHVQDHLHELIRDYGVWVYAILFLIVFCETGLVVTPFLPGDSLLFAAGALAMLPGSPLDPALLAGVLLAAAVLGDAVNYHIGAFLGPAAFQKDRRWLKKAHLEAAHAFYEKHGGKSIVLARFVPIVRTFAPFVAGVARMTYHRFLVFNFTGAVLWILVCMGGGMLFGNIPVVQKNFSLVALGIVVISVLPMVVAGLKARMGRAAPAGS